MIDEKYQLLEAGVTMRELKELDEGVEYALEEILEEFDYEPNDVEGLSSAVRDACYEHIFEFAEVSDDGDIVDKFEGIKSDFIPHGNSHARASISVLIGGRYAEDKDSDAVKKDLIWISNEMMKKNYEQR